MSHRGYDCDNCSRQLTAAELVTEDRGDPITLTPRNKLRLSTFLRVEPPTDDDDEEGVVDAEPLDEYVSTSVHLCSDCVTRVGEAFPRIAEMVSKSHAELKADVMTGMTCPTGRRRFSRRRKRIVG